MDQLPEKRNRRFADAAAGHGRDERTLEMDRETLDDGVSRITNDSMVHETDGAHKTEIYANDYEKALPNHYQLIRMIGRGGMSEVFLAEDQRLGRKVAIKFLNSEFRRDPDRMRRFNQEARAASALNHPNILIIHDIGENHGVQFIVSEFVEGETLGARIARGKLPVAEAVHISIQIVSALMASHNAGIVHRDIKPDNVMIRRDGSVKVLDFGLAKETGVALFDSVGLEARTLEGATSPGLILGTPQYMSPEQARGKQLDPRTDIFSIGVILFEMVTANQPFPGTSMVDIIAAVISKEPRPLDEFLENPPASLVRIIEIALRKDKEERYATTEQLLSDLKNLQMELSEVPFLARETNGSQVRATRDNTVRSILSSRPLGRPIPILLAFALPVAALIFWWISTGSVGWDSSSSQSAMRMVPITSWSSGIGELVSAASFSPDAKMIAYAATRTGATEIWAKPVSGGEPIQVTKNGSYNQYPVWSPNNQDIAFFSSRDGSNGIWRVSFTGGTQVQIASGVGTAARTIMWSKGGKIYFQDGNDLFAVDDRGGERSRVTDFAGKGLKPRTIELSGDEKSLAYSIRENGAWKVYIGEIGSQQFAEVAASNEQIDQLAWNADGKSIIYSCSAEGAYQVFRTGAGYAKPVQLSNGNLDFFVQDVSSDGSKVLYGSVTETSDLWSVDVADGKQTPLANEVAAEFWPDVSPDGRSIVYQSVNQADRPYRGAINSKSPGGSSSPTVLAPEGFAPVFSRDGMWVAFFRRSDSGISIWRVRANGGEAVKLADGNIIPPGYLATPYLKIGSGHISWSPDNSSVAYSAKADGVSNIWLALADGANRMVTGNKDAADNYCCPIWSPDGKSIFFSSDLIGTSRKRSYKLWALDALTLEQKIVFESDKPFRPLGFAEGGNEIVIAEKLDVNDLGAVPEWTKISVRTLKSGAQREVLALSKAYFNNIQLSPDGRTIAFATRRDDLSALWTAPAAGGQPKQLLVENDPKILISSLVWSPDGRSIVFGKQTRTNLLSMLSN
jgi:eukaryotic-like serine/threonine-protein kinase